MVLSTGYHYTASQKIHPVIRAMARNGTLWRHLLVGRGITCVYADGVEYTEDAKGNLVPLKKEAMGVNAIS